MKKMTTQYLLKMPPELMKTIDMAFSCYLKNTGQYITKAQFVRNILEKQCNSIIKNKK